MFLLFCQINILFIVTKIFEWYYTLEMYCSFLRVGPDCSVIWLTHCGRVTHICVVKLTIIGSDGLSPGRCQAIIWTNDGILLIGPLGTNFIKILIGIQTFSFKKMHLKMSSAKWRPFRLGLNVFTFSHARIKLCTIAQMDLVRQLYTFLKQ